MKYNKKNDRKNIISLNCCENEWGNMYVKQSTRESPQLREMVCAVSVYKHCTPQKASLPLFPFFA